jgi:hypothetical protein
MTREGKVSTCMATENTAVTRAYVWTEIRAQREGCDDLDERVRLMKEIKLLEDTQDNMHAKLAHIRDQIERALQGINH